MFPSRYFAPRYFAPRYWAKVGAVGVDTYMTYASANSRIPLSCVELGEVKLTFHWPASIRIGNRSPRGLNLNHYKPALLDNKLAWSNP